MRDQRRDQGTRWTHSGPWTLIPRSLQSLDRVRDLIQGFPERLEEVRELLANPMALAAMARPTFPFGDGRAGPRIAAIVVEWLEQRSLTRRLA